MKKIVSLVMAIVMVALMLPVGVLAAGEIAVQMWYDSDKSDNKTKDLRTIGEIAADVSVDWTITSGEDCIELNKTKGTITAKEKEGNAVVKAIVNTEPVVVKVFNITVSKRAVVEENGVVIAPVNANKKYYAGDTIEKSHFAVKVNFDSGDNNVVVTDYTLTIKKDGTTKVDESTSLKAGNYEVTATYGGKTSAPISVTVENRTISKVAIESVSNYAFTVGDTELPEFKLKITYNNNETSIVSAGFDIYLGDVNCKASGFTFTKELDGKKFKLSYEGFTVETLRTITVTESSTGTETTTPSTGTYTITCDATGLVKKEYKVGETFDPSGIKVFAQKNGGAKIQKNYSVKTGTATVFSSTTQTTASVTILVNVESNKYEEFVLEVSGLTVKAASVTLDPYSITSIKMDSDGYAIGHNFDVSDINYIYYKAEQSSSRTQLFASAFANYSDEFTLEVRKTNGSAKTSKKTIIEEANVYTADDDDDVKLVNLRFSIGSEYIDFTVEVIEPKVSYYYDDDLVAVYDSLATALNYTEEQDPEIEEYYFDLSDVDDDEHILLVLGADASMSSSSAKFDVKHNIEIDLNGHDLTFRSTTVDDFDDEDYTVTIKNTAEEEATFTYYDKDIDIILEEDDEFVFEKGYDEEDYLPGVVVVSLDVPTTGTVTANTTITNKKIAVGMGNEVKLTITPKSGYGIDTVLLGGKSVTSSSDYKLTSTGATYTFKPKENVIVKVTFKETASDWDNPFTDVSSNAKYYTAVAFVCENNLFKGVSSTKFSPNGTMTRAMFATVLARLADVDVSRYTTSSFTDVSSSDLRLTEEMVQSIEWACRMGLVEGYGDGTFGPHNEITHQQMYLIMYRYTLYVENKPANVSSVSLTVADKNDVADWALNGVKFAEKNELLIASSSNKITPKAAAVRSELAMLLEKYCNNVLGWADEE